MVRRALTDQHLGELRHPRLEITMLALAVLMIPIVIIQETAEDAGTIVLAERASAVIWFAFLAEYLYLFVTASDRRRFVGGHWFDLVIIFLTPPVVFVPEELTALRSLRVLRLVRVLAVLGRAQHTLRQYLRRDSLPYVLALSLMVIFLGGLGIHAIEPETSGSVGDGIWWAAATLSTVGYGDIAPTTFVGRIVAVVLMILGVGTFGALTATLAAYFIESEDGTAKELAAMRSQLSEVQRQLDLLTRRLG